MVPEPAPRPREFRAEPGHLAPETLRVVHFAADGQLVQDEVVAHEGRRLNQAPVQGDRASRASTNPTGNAGCARSPAAPEIRGWRPVQERGPAIPPPPRREAALRRPVVGRRRHPGHARSPGRSRRGRSGPSAPASRRTIWPRNRNLRSERHALGLEGRVASRNSSFSTQAEFP